MRRDSTAGVLVVLQMISARGAATVVAILHLAEWLIGLAALGVAMGMPGIRVWHATSGTLYLVFVAYLLMLKSRGGATASCGCFTDTDQSLALGIARNSILATATLIAAIVEPSVMSLGARLGNLGVAVLLLWTLRIVERVFGNSPTGSHLGV